MYSYKSQHTFQVTILICCVATIVLQNRRSTIKHNKKSTIIFFIYPILRMLFKLNVE